MSFLFVDRILSSLPGEYIYGLKQVTAEDTYLAFDEECGRFCFIPSLIGETLGQLAAWNVMHHCGFTLRPVAGIVASARVLRPAWVGETLLLEAHIEQLDDKAVQYRALARVGDEEVFRVDGALGPLLGMEDFISTRRAKQQYAQLYRPGELVDTPPKKYFLEQHSIPYPMTFDAVLDYQPGVRLVAQKQISSSAPYFSDHFPKKPVLPLTVLLACQTHLAREFLKQSKYTEKYRIVELRKIKMSEFVRPGDTVICTVQKVGHTPHELVLHFRTEVQQKRVCVMEMVLLA